MTDHQKLVYFFMDELPEDSPWVGNVKSLVEKLIANGVTFATENNVGGKWIPVTERLPKGGEIVLCNTKYFFEILQWDERADMWVDQYRSYRKNYVSHWQYLPQPPKGE